MTNIEAYNEMMRDMVDIFFVLDITKENEITKVTNFTFDFNYNLRNIADCNLKVVVNKGRKWKGEGFLVGYFTKEFCTGYRVVRTSYCKIYDPKTNRIESIPANNVTFTNTKEVIDNYIKYISETINNSNITDLDFNYIGNTLTIGLKHNFKGFVDWMFDNKTFIDIENAYDEIEDEKKKKYEAFKNEKMPVLIEWVKEHTDKKGDEIIKLAEHIFEKRYGNK